MTHPETPPIPAKKRKTTHWKAVALQWKRCFDDEASSRMRLAEDFAAETDRATKLSNALTVALTANGLLEADKWFWQRIAIGLGTVAAALALWLGFR